MKFSIAKIMSNTLPVALLSVAMPMLVLSACGGAGSSAGGSGGGSYLSQMGGVLQGVALNLTQTVSTFAGLSSLNKNADGIGAAASFNAPLASVSDGTNLYIADSANNTIRKVVIATGEASTLAGSSAVAAGALDGTGTAALFNTPSGITTDGVNLYIADTGSNSIRKISPASGVTVGEITSATATVTTLVSTGLNAPSGIAFDNTNLYVTDTLNHRIVKLTGAGAATTFAGLTSTSGARDGTGTGARFNQPTGIIVVGTNLYVTDKVNNKIRKISIASITSGSTVSLTGTASIDSRTAAGPATAVDSPTAASVTFNGPKGITSDGTYLYVADTGNNKIRKVSLDGATTSLTGTGVANTAANVGYADDTASSATFRAPAGITTDGTHLYVSDTGNYTIRQIAPKSGATLGTMTDATATVSTYAGISIYHNPADGTGITARLDSPQYSTTDGINLYVTSCGNKSEIRKVVIATGVVTTLAGSAVPGSADGLGTLATFDCPSGITNDGINLYVADSGNNTIRMIAASGVGATLSNMTSANAAVSTMVSGLTAPLGITTDGISLYVADDSGIVRLAPPSGASLSSMAAASGVASSITAGAFGSPAGITSNGKNLYVADKTNHNILMIAPPTGASLSSMDAASAVVSSITTSTGSGAEDDIGSLAIFDTPTDITTDGTNLYVVDYNNNKIRMIAPTTGATLSNISAASAVVSSITGASGVAVTAGYADGAGAAASFSGPTGITTDGVSLYVMDSGSGTIRKIK